MNSNTFDKTELREIIETMSHSLSLRGEVLNYTMLKGYKKYEYRSRNIRHKYVAFHVSGTKELKTTIQFLNNEMKRYGYKLPDEKDLKQIPKKHIVAVIKFKSIKTPQEVGSISENFSHDFHNFCGNKCHEIEKIVMLKNPIPVLGMQCVPWPLNKRGDLKYKIIQELF